MSVEIALIAAVARNGVIGREGALPWTLPDDLARFARLTRGGSVVMGRGTWESIGRSALPKRRNLVLSRSLESAPGAELVRTIAEAIERAGDVKTLWVIGGERVYEAFLPCADRLELTEIDAVIPGDARFPDFDRDEWELAEREHHAADARHASAFTFATYRRRARH